MPTDGFSVFDIIARLPYKLRPRFDSLSGYVRTLIDDELREIGSGSIPNESIQYIQMAAFLFSLNRFFRDGTRAAYGASITFQSLGMEGFLVGSTHFTPSNENTLRGQELAIALMHALNDTELGRRVKTAYSLTDLVTSMTREAAHGNTVG
jgi:hypothetical protein